MVNSPSAGARVRPYLDVEFEDEGKIKQESLSLGALEFSDKKNIKCSFRCVVENNITADKTAAKKRRRQDI